MAVIFTQGILSLVLEGQFTAAREISVHLPLGPPLAAPSIRRSLLPMLALYLLPPRLLVRWIGRIHVRLWQCGWNESTHWRNVVSSYVKCCWHSTSFVISSTSWPNSLARVVIPDVAWRTFKVYSTSCREGLRNANSSSNTKPRRATPHAVPFADRSYIHRNFFVANWSSLKTQKVLDATRWRRICLA
jgi:hypothetical protein